MEVENSVRLDEEFDDDFSLILTREAIEKNLSLIGEAIVKLSVVINDSKKELFDIQNRNWFKRLTNNNTRDLASAMLSQNETFSVFITIIQGVIFLCMNNLVVLGAIMDSLEKQELENATEDEQNDLRHNQYFSISKDYLAEAIITAQKARATEIEVENTKDTLQKLKKVVVASLVVGGFGFLVGLIILFIEIFM